MKKKEIFEEENENENMRKKKRFVPRKIKSLMRKKEKLSDRILKSRSWQKNHKVIQEIEEIEKEIDDGYKKKRMEEENKARMNLRDNPAFFYIYAKKFSKTNSQLTSLVKKDGSVVTDPQSKRNFSASSTSPCSANLRRSSGSRMLMTSSRRSGRRSGTRSRSKRSRRSRRSRSSHLYAV